MPVTNVRTVYGSVRIICPSRRLLEECTCSTSRCVSHFQALLQDTAPPPPPPPAAAPAVIPSGSHVLPLLLWFSKVYRVLSHMLTSHALVFGRTTRRFAARHSTTTASTTSSSTNGETKRKSRAPAAVVLQGRPNA